MANSPGDRSRRHHAQRERANSLALPIARSVAFWCSKTARSLADGDIAAAAYAAYRLGLADGMLTRQAQAWQISQGAFES